MPRALAGYDIEAKNDLLMTFDVHILEAKHQLQGHMRWFYTVNLVYNRAFFAQQCLRSFKRFLTGACQDNTFPGNTILAMRPVGNVYLKVLINSFVV